MEAHNKAEMLRIVTAGSVDDGKSTLIGRLLFDTKQIFIDQLDALKEASKRRGFENIDLSLIVDGLKAEREQGITIDVAHRYFSTPKRKFILYDTPGHMQYTRNMITGASNAHLAIILIDARNGVMEQTKRHALILTLLQIPHIVICINKMDLVNYSRETFEKIKANFENFSSKLDFKDVSFIPISALNGDNIVNKSSNMDWFGGPTLLYTLENVYIASDYNLRDCRFPIQYVIRPKNEAFQDFRGYAGRIESGIFKPRDKITVLPSGFTTKIKTIETFDGKLAEAFPPMSATITLEDDIDISRGYMFVRENNIPTVNQDLDLMVCWLNPVKLDTTKRYTVMHTTREVKCIVKEILYKIDINTLHRIEKDTSVGMNEFARIKIRTSEPLFFDSYLKNKSTGSLIFIDEGTNETVALGLIR